MTPATLHKVTVFITRPAPAGGVELLLFQHPDAGVQIPAGTVEEGETLDAAALREGREESALENLRLVRSIGYWEEDFGLEQRAMLRRAVVYSRPDPGSFDWATLPRGPMVHWLRQQNGYTQISYQEDDRFPDPRYVSYQITGWVADDCLAGSLQRHFFHLAAGGGPQSRWSTYTDGHIFRPFWAPLDQLPQIVSPQDRWLPYVQEQLGYRFDRADR